MIGVADLKLAIANYRKLGFRVEHGGIHSGRVSHNGLIYLSDGTFLELFAFRPNFKTSFLRWMGKMGGQARWKRKASKGHLARFTRNLYGKEGLMDVCVRTPHLRNTVQRLRGKKIKVSDPKAFYRLRPDKIRMGWELAFPKKLTLPFIIGPVMPNILREPEEFEHANGVRGIRSLTIAVTDLATHIQWYQDLLEQAPSDSSDSEASFQLPTLKILLKKVAAKKEEGLQEIELFSTESNDSPLSDGLLHGARIFLSSSQ